MRVQVPFGCPSEFRRSSTRAVFVHPNAPAPACVAIGVVFSVYCKIRVRGAAQCAQLHPVAPGKFSAWHCRWAQVVDGDQGPVARHMHACILGPLGPPGIRSRAAAPALHRHRTPIPPLGMGGSGRAGGCGIKGSCLQKPARADVETEPS